MEDQEEMRAAAFTALLDWHPGFATMAPEVWEPLVDRMSDAWRARRGGGTFHLFAKEWIAAEYDQLARWRDIPTDIHNSSDRRAVWESGQDPNDPANYDPPEDDE